MQCALRHGGCVTFVYIHSPTELLWFMMEMQLLAMAVGESVFGTLRSVYCVKVVCGMVAAVALTGAMKCALGHGGCVLIVYIAPLTEDGDGVFEFKKLK